VNLLTIFSAIARTTPSLGAQKKARVHTRAF
jgi:hypothetical protein